MAGKFVVIILSPSVSVFPAELQPAQVSMTETAAKADTILLKIRIFPHSFCNLIRLLYHKFIKNASKGKIMVAERL